MKGRLFDKPAQEIIFDLLVYPCLGCTSSVHHHGISSASPRLSSSINRPVT